jgi:hypothetical protein
MQINNYHHGSEAKLTECTSDETDQRLVGLIGNSRRSDEQVAKSSKPKSNQIASSQEFLSKSFIISGQGRITRWSDYYDQVGSRRYRIIPHFAEGVEPDRQSATGGV